MKLSTVIVNWNTSDLLRVCLASLHGQGTVDNEVVVVDNGSTDSSVGMIERCFPNVKLIRNPDNLYYTRAVNQGLRLSSGDLILLLNSDTELKGDSLNLMIDTLVRREHLAGVSPMLIDHEGNNLRSCMRFPTLQVPLFYFTSLGALFPNNAVIRRYYMKDWDQADSRIVEQPPGACLLLRREALERAGLLDERMALYFSDVDLCRVIWRNGGRLLYLAEAKVYHSVGASTSALPEAVGQYHKDRIVYYRKAYGVAGAFVCKLSLVDLALRESAAGFRRATSGLEWTRSTARIFSILGECLRH